MIKIPDYSKGDTLLLLLLLASNGNLLTLQGPAIVLGMLSSAGKPLNMPYPSVALNLLQPPYIKRIKPPLKLPQNRYNIVTKRLTQRKNNKQKVCKRKRSTRSPSIMYLETSSLRVMSSSSVRSLVILLSMLISHRILRALLLPIPWMYWSENSNRLLFGISTPPTRTHWMLKPLTCMHTPYPETQKPNDRNWNELENNVCYLGMVENRKRDGSRKRFGIGDDRERRSHGHCQRLCHLLLFAAQSSRIAIALSLSLPNPIVWIRKPVWKPGQTINPYQHAFGSGLLYISWAQFNSSCYHMELWYGPIGNAWHGSMIYLIQKRIKHSSDVISSNMTA